MCIRDRYLTKVRAIGIFYLIQYLIVALIFTIVAICTKAVSYTHLDVYKRQVQAIGLALLVLFFVVGMVRTCGSFSDVKKPEHAVKLFILSLIHI